MLALEQELVAAVQEHDSQQRAKLAAEEELKKMSEQEQKDAGLFRRIH